MLNVLTGFGERGSVAVETASALAIVSTVLGMGFVLVYLAFAKAWLDRTTRETAVCMASSISKSKCRQKMQATLDSALPWGSSEVRRLRRDSNGSRVELRFNFGESYSLESKAQVQSP